MPQVAGSIDELLALLRASHASSPGGPMRPVHGDMHPGQWLEADQGGRLGLLDFDDFSYGDPERDVAFWLTQMQSEYGFSGTPAESFINGYEAVAGRLNEKLISTYMAHKWLSKGLKAARALRPDGASIAEKCLAEGRLLLRGKPVSFCPLEQPQTVAAAASGAL